MPDKKQLIVPREPTPPPDKTRDSRPGTHLPHDIVSERVDRLALFSLVALVLWTVGLMMDFVIKGADVPTRYPIQSEQHFIIEIIGMVSSALMFVFVRYGKQTAETKSDVSLLYLIASAGLIAAMNTWVSPPPTRAYIMQLSWVNIAILVYSMIAPASPRKMLAGALVAASLDPFGVWLAYLRGVPVSSPLETAILFWPNFASAGLSTIPSHMLHKVGQKLTRARELGSYELVRLLGNGGMGEVWEAKHRLLARRAAVKLVRPELLGASSEDEARVVLKRFEREAQATSALSSPHTIQVYDFGSTNDGTFYYVMELLAGRDLESLVREFGPIPAARAGYLLRQVCHSLADAHARGLVHRDIKPANIYVCRMGLEYDFVKVLDFGLVKVNSQSPGERIQTLMSAEHRTTGTPAYMAPEIILGETTVDRRADVYALGCVAYYILTGRLVFEADTPMKMFLQHVQAEPIPPSERTELPIPPEIDELVLACLQKDPARRPQNAEVLLEMACGCKTGDCWSSNQAKSWWEKHLPEFTGALSLGEYRPEVGPRAIVLQ